MTSAEQEKMDKAYDRKYRDVLRHAGREPRCQKRSVSDQYTCHRCGLTWDKNDIDPPTCRVTGEPA